MPQYPQAPPSHIALGKLLRLSAFHFLLSRAFLLDRRARNISIGGKDTALTLLRLHEQAALLAYIDILARIRRRRLG